MYALIRLAVGFSKAATRGQKAKAVAGYAGYKTVLNTVKGFEKNAEQELEEMRTVVQGKCPICNKTQEMVEGEETSCIRCTSIIIKYPSDYKLEANLIEYIYPPDKSQLVRGMTPRELAKRAAKGITEQ